MYSVGWLNCHVNKHLRKNGVNVCVVCVREKSEWENRGLRCCVRLNEQGTGILKGCQTPLLRVSLEVERVRMEHKNEIFELSSVRSRS